MPIGVPQRSFSWVSWSSKGSYSYISSRIISGYSSRNASWTFLQEFPSGVSQILSSKAFPEISLSVPLGIALETLPSFLSVPPRIFSEVLSWVFFWSLSGNLLWEFLRGFSSRISLGILVGAFSVIPAGHPRAVLSRVLLILSQEFLREFFHYFFQKFFWKHPSWVSPSGASLEISERVS